MTQHITCIQKACWLTSVSTHRYVHSQSWYFCLCDSQVLQSERLCSSSGCMRRICNRNALCFTPPPSLLSLEKTVDKSYPHRNFSSPHVAVQELNFCRGLERCVTTDGGAYSSEVTSFSTQHQLINVSVVPTKSETLKSYIKVQCDKSSP